MATDPAPATNAQREAFRKWWETPWAEGHGYVSERDIGEFAFLAGAKWQAALSAQQPPVTLTAEERNELKVAHAILAHVPADERAALDKLLAQARLEQVNTALFISSKHVEKGEDGGRAALEYLLMRKMELESAAQGENDGN